MIVSDKDTLSGSPRIDGTRIPVYIILDTLAEVITGTYDFSAAEMVEVDYPGITVDQVVEAVRYAAGILRKRRKL